MAGPCTSGFWKWTALVLIITNATLAQGNNLAFGKPAIQSSTRGNDVASRAVDGNTDTNIDHDSCTHTNGEANPFWRVDLGQTYRVGSVVIFNRKDCCADRLNPFNIHIGDSEAVTMNPRCGGSHNIDVNQVSITVPCNMPGRYVGIRLVGNHRTLTLCEVEVFAGNNIALGKSADQTSTRGNDVAGRAVDGNTDTNIDHGSCTHTELDQTNPFWRLYLGRSYLVDSVVIFNRQDCCAERLNPFSIHIGDFYDFPTNPSCGGVQNIDLNQPAITVPCNMSGKYVGIRLVGNDRTLSLCEVEVFSAPTEGTTVSPVNEHTTLTTSTEDRVVSTGSTRSVRRSRGVRGPVESWVMVLLNMALVLVNNMAGLA